MYWLEKVALPPKYHICRSLVLQDNPWIVLKTKETIEFCRQTALTYAKTILGGTLFSKYRDFDDAVLTWYCKARFEQQKQVFLLNRSLYESLTETVGIENINKDILRTLPYEAFWLDMVQTQTTLSNGQTVDGCFVGYDLAIMHDKTYEEFNLLIRLVKDGNSQIIPVNFCFTEGNSSDSLIAATSEWDNSTKSTELKQLAKNILQVVVYMCSVKPDIVKRPKRKSKASDKQKVKQITINEVGYRIGPTLGAAKVVYTDVEPTTNGSATKSKAPHFRRPHWSTYHVGKGRKETVVKWINLILVNGDKGDPNITIHKIL